MGHLKAEGLIKSYKDKKVLDNISFTAEKGELLSILGESGSGKTTLLKIIAGLVPNDKGRIYVNDRDITEMPPQKRKTAMVFQEYLLFPHMSVLENVEFSLKVKGMDKSRRRERVLEYIKLVQLNGLESRYPHELSGGQKQRIAVARALVSEPELLLLDEPFSSLDSNLRFEMCEFIKCLQRDMKLTTIMVTHDRIEAMRISDRIVILHNGGVAQEGTPEHIYKSPNSIFTARFMGDINIIKGHAKNGSFYSDGGFSFPYNEEDGEYSVIVRPENIFLCENYKRGFVKVMVTDKTFSGDRVNYMVKAGESGLKVSSPSHACAFEKGMDAYVEIPQEYVKRVME